jgi:hypothetical protein
LDPKNTQIKPGDIVCRWRKSSKSAVASHCDIVVSVSGTRADAIGGNVGHTAKHRNVSMNGGLLATNKPWYAVLRRK